MSFSNQVAGFAEGRIKMMAVKVMGERGFGTQTSIFSGINYAIRNGARVSSNSYGGISFSAARALEVILNQVFWLLQLQVSYYIVCTYFC